MAINLLSQYPGKVDPVVAAWPYGEPRNITIPGDGTGTPWEAALVKDIVGLQQALLKSAAIVPSGTPDEVGASQYLQAITMLAAGIGGMFTDTGISSTAFVATPGANQEFPPLFDGLTIRFIPNSNNGVNPTLNYNGTVDNIIDPYNGINIRQLTMLTIREAILRFNGVDWVLLNHPSYRIAGVGLGSGIGFNSAPLNSTKFVIGLHDVTLDGSGYLKLKMYEDVAGTPTIVSTGYASAAIKVTDGSKITDTTSFVLATNTIPAGNKIDGVITLTKTGLTDKWTIGGSLHDNTANEMFTVGGSITLSNQTAGIILFNGGSTSFTGGDWSYDYTAQLQYE